MSSGGRFIVHGRQYGVPQSGHSGEIKFDFPRGQHEKIGLVSEIAEKVESWLERFQIWPKVAGNFRGNSGPSKIEHVSDIRYHFLSSSREGNDSWELIFF